MALQQAVRTPWIPKLTLENYINLEHMDVISSAMLRKIIMMHGYNSNKVLKHDLLDAVRSINLMDVHHSTLQSDVSSNAFLNLSDVIKDLSSLRWHECCITSIQTVNSENHFSSVVNDLSPISFKRNSNTACSLKDDSEAHKTQSPTFKKIKGNPLSAFYGEQVDQDNSPKSCYEEPVDQIKITKIHSGKQMGQLLMLKVPRTKHRRKSRYEKQVGQANTPKARTGKQAREAKTPGAHYEEQDGQANIP
uniref:uncharacterized protein LOC122580281 n=1 Tax=Erigeron canadensis TaxID=72917 RepID=UPI001CB8A367|nr:uncharacterized protein LOC122580281 [Erigeron canadensis]